MIVITQPEGVVSVDEKAAKQALELGAVEEVKTRMTARKSAAKRTAKTGSKERGGRAT